MNHEELQPWEIIGLLVALLFVVRAIYYYFHYR